jgi:predicted nucleic acid-binding protein
MTAIIYILDTNAITDRINEVQSVKQEFNNAIIGGHRLYLCPPIYYEVMRGLDFAGQQAFEQGFVPALEWVELVAEDWKQAAAYWSSGQHLSDVNLLLAALACRLNGVVVSADEGFNALPVKRDNWRAK